MGKSNGRRWTGCRSSLPVIELKLAHLTGCKLRCTWELKTASFVRGRPCSKLVQLCLSRSMVLYNLAAASASTRLRLLWGLQSSNMSRHAREVHSPLTRNSMQCHSLDNRAIPNIPLAQAQYYCFVPACFPQSKNVAICWQPETH